MLSWLLRSVYTRHGRFADLPAPVALQVCAPPSHGGLALDMHIGDALPEAACLSSATLSQAALHHGPADFRPVTDPSGHTWMPTGLP